MNEEQILFTFQPKGYCNLRVIIQNNVFVVLEGISLDNMKQIATFEYPQDMIDFVYNRRK